MSITLFQCNCLLALRVLIYESFGNSDVALDIEIVALPEFANCVYHLVRICTHGRFKRSEGRAKAEPEYKFVSIFILTLLNISNS